MPTFKLEAEAVHHAENCGDQVLILWIIGRKIEIV
jgi:hypothetical protein